MGWSDVRHHYEDYDPQDCAPDWKVLSSSHHTARMPKTCQNCEGLIHPGERYAKLVALDEGKFTIICTHDDKDACRAMAAQVEQWRAEQAAQPIVWDCATCGRSEPCENCVAF